MCTYRNKRQLSNFKSPKISYCFLLFSQNLKANVSYVDARLFPEEWNWTSDLNVGGRFVAEKDDLLRFGEVGHLAVVVDTANLKSEKIILN